MWLTKISIRNYLGISNFKTETVGKLNTLTGRNGEGKTAVCGAIRNAIESSGIAPELIKLHEHEAEILIEIDDKIGIRRRLTDSSNQVKVTIDGQPVSAPQKFLDTIIGPYNLNPVDFYLGRKAEDRKKRRDAILRAMPFRLDQAHIVDALGDTLIPIDLSHYSYERHGLDLLEQIASDVYKRRAEQNVEVTRLKKAIEQSRLDIPKTFNQETYKSTDLTKLTERLSTAKTAVNQHANNERRLEDLRQQAHSTIARIEALKKQLADEEKKLESTNAEGQTLKKKIEEYAAPDVGAIQTELANYESSQRLMLKIEEIERMEGQHATAEQTHKALDVLHVKLVQDVPKALLKQMRLPIEGLALNGDEITVDGVSIDTLSTSEQMRFAVKVARCLAGPLKLICVDRFESLDPEARAAFEEEALGDDFQYIITQVTSGDLNLEVKDAPGPVLTAKEPAPVMTTSTKSKTKSKVDF